MSSLLSSKRLSVAIVFAVVVLAISAGLLAARSDSEAESAGGNLLPISDLGDHSNGAPVQPATTLEPLIPVVAAPPEGELVATALIKEGEVEVWSTPDESEPTWLLPVPTEFWGDRHFLVLDEVNGWYQILVPVRPNETVGWIPADAVTISYTNFNVQIDISERSVKVWEGDELILDTSSVVGRDSAPTPLGNFYIRDVLLWDETSVYGPYVLALSAYSEAIDEINGGDAVVAIHGTSRPELIGGAASLGCIRLDNGDITLIAETVPVGTPVEIVA